MKQFCGRLPKVAHSQFTVQTNKKVKVASFFQVDTLQMAKPKVNVERHKHTRFKRMAMNLTNSVRDQDCYMRLAVSLL